VSCGIEIKASLQRRGLKAGADGNSGTVRRPGDISMTALDFGKKSSSGFADSVVDGPGNI